MTRVLVIAPHPDDESIGCGGTICVHSDRGDRVHTVFLSSGERGIPGVAPEEAGRIREGEARAAAQVLRVSDVEFLRCPDGRVGGHVVEAAAVLAPIVERVAPELIYLPHAGDAHPDHQAALPIVRMAVAACGAVGVTLLTYEIWTPLTSYYHVENVTAVMDRKLSAIRCHASQLTQFAYDRAIRGLNIYRGVVAGACRYAEIFETADVAAPASHAP